MRRSRQPLHHSHVALLLCALAASIGQATSLVASYAVGLEARFLAVIGSVVITFIVATLPLILKKKCSM